MIQRVDDFVLIRVGNRREGLQSGTGRFMMIREVAREFWEIDKREWSCSRGGKSGLNFSTEIVNSGTVRLKSRG